jgi:hypothetical protein
MARIIAGGFVALTDAQAAVQRLVDAGISPDDLCKYHVNPAGAHNGLPAGGDHDASPGAEHAGRGAVKGAAVGAAVGLAAGAAAATVVGPLGLAAGAAVGAYTGSLWGSLKQIDVEPQPGHESVRPAETLVAINVAATGMGEEELVRLLEECGATQVESAEGEWVEGEWASFDPTSPPHLIGGRDARSPGSRPGL